MKKHIETFKVLWANKKMRSLIILAFYAIFFTVVIIAFGNREVVTNEIPKTAMQEFRENKHYRYNLVVNNEKSYSVSVFSSEATTLPAELKFLNNEFIYKLVSTGLLQGVNNNFSENYKDSIYKIDANKASKLLVDSKAITLTIREKEQKIERVVIEFDESYNGLIKLELNYSW